MDEPVVEYVVETKSKDIAESEPIEIVIDKNNRFRRVMRATLIKNNMRDADASVKIELLCQTRKSKTAWEDCETFTIPHMKAGEEVKLCFDSVETLALFQHLANLYEASGCPMSFGKNRIVVMNRDYLTGREQEVVDLLLERNPEFINAVNRQYPSVMKALMQQQWLAERQQAVEEFEHHLFYGDWSELDWSKFFDEQKWIFGHGLSYQILNLLQSEAHYGGMAIDGKGDQRGDRLMCTEAAVRFTVLVEIKTPETSLLKSKRYRNGAYAVSDELAGAVAQVQANCAQCLHKASTDPEMIREHSKQNLWTVQPEGIVIIGSTAGLGSDQDRIQSFQHFRSNLHNPRVVTFDELVERAKFMVYQDEAEMTVGKDEPQSATPLTSDETDYDPFAEE
jgi:hypothetical protein